jgi:hypothetical protein
LAGSFGGVNDYSFLRINADELIIAVDPRWCTLVVDMALRAHVWERPELVAGGWRRQLRV